MDPIDPTSPNLDGDFKAILQLQKTRPKKEKRKAPKLSTLEENDNEVEDHITAKLSTELHSQPPERTVLFTSDQIKPLREELMKGVKEDNISACKTVRNKLEALGVNLSHPELRDPETNANPFHYALICKSMRVAEYFINSSNDEFLLQDFTISVKGVQSKKTGLHILTEQGNLEFTKSFLERIQDKQAKSQYLQKTVLMELEGQRPRHLSSIHIAALTGNTELIELLQSLGVEVNTKNNKNDTPILWAARNNHIPTVRRLIQLGADLHCENDKGSTPLYWAVRYGFTDLVKILIEEGQANIHQRRKLGLVSPVVLASALGYDQIVGTLIQHGANPNTHITGGQTALQMAAANDNDDVIEMLLNNGADIDKPDESGNTPLMYAAKRGHMDCIEVLINNNANMDCKNKMGDTIWDFAMDAKDDNLLKVLVTLYQKKQGENKRGHQMTAGGKPPLHVAAQKGDIGKIKCLFQLGVSPETVDQSGNTYFHIAAREDIINVIEQFLDSVDVNKQNSDGETAMHIAVKSGHIDTVELLLKKAKLDIRDNTGYTVLHEAARSPMATQELITILIDVMVKTTHWSLVDAAAERGNTALHIACRKGRTDILEALSSLNPMNVNEDGDTPLHVAAKAGMGRTLEVFLEIFSQTGKGLHIDKRNKDGESALHICAKQGDMDRVRLLAEYGSDLALQNEEGNTVLHELAEHSMFETDKKDAYLAVVQAFVDVAPRWWCTKKNLHIPDEDTEKYMNYRKEAVLHLASGIYNKEGLDALTYAGSMGAINISQAILNIPYVYKFSGTSGYIYDVTNLAPETLANAPRSARKTSFNKTATVGVIEDQDEDYRPSSRSFLDVVVKLDDEVLGAKVLDVTPVRQMINNYWNAYQWIYGLLMIVHCVYMACFTAYSIPTLQSFYENVQNSVTNNDPNLWPMSLFLVWPVILLIFEVYYIVRYAIKMCSNISEIGIRQHLCPNRVTIVTLPNTIIDLLFSFLSHFIAIFFVGLVLAWFIMYAVASSKQANLVACVLILGWMYSIAFTKGFQTVHAFSIMLKYIIIKDILRFLFIFVFVLLGFSFAFQALFQIAPTVTLSGWDTFVMSFNLMLGLDSFLDDSFENDYVAAGGSFLFVQIVYLGYIALSTIVLLNLLIAMMSDTYTSVKAKEGTTWKVGSVRLALSMESSVPFLKKFFKAIGIIDDPLTLDLDTNRWMMTVPFERSEIKATDEVSEVIKSMERLETKVSQLQYDLSMQIEAISAKVEGRDGNTKLRRFRALVQSAKGSRSLKAPHGRRMSKF